MFFELITADVTTSLLVGLLAAIITSVILRILEDRKYPPGPTGLPFLGYLPFLTKNPHLTFVELKKKYGPVYSLRMGSKTVVMLCDYPSMKEAFHQEAAAGRPRDSFLGLSQETIETEAFNGLPWKDQRRFALHALRDLGFGKSQMEIHIREEIEELLTIFASHKEEPIVAEKYLTPSASNVVASFMFGKRRKFNDPKRIKIDQLFKDSRQSVGRAIFLSFFPFLMKVATAFNIGLKDNRRVEIEMGKFVQDEIKEHQETLDPNHIRDFVDGYLLEIEKKKNDPTSTFRVKILEDVVQAFFGAGSETIMGTVDWLIFLSAAFPKMQKRVQSEIDSVLGSERFPSRSDYLQMPYTEAVILETLRWRANLPINVPRYTLGELKVKSYVIPKGTELVSVFWAINHDPELWGSDVESFKPERFLSADGKQIKKPEHFVPFSIGRRSCPGEGLAVVELFLYFTAILQKFHILFPEGFTPDFEGDLVFGLQAKPYKVIFKQRK